MARWIAPALSSSSQTRRRISWRRGDATAASPDWGGIYVYLRAAFGPGLAFLFGWTMFLVIGSGSLATLGAAFPRYVGVFVPLSPAGVKVVSLLMVAAVTVLNIRGTRQSA